jgi:hypothetical protein
MNDIKQGNEKSFQLKLSKEKRLVMKNIATVEKNKSESISLSLNQLIMIKFLK